MAIDEHYIKTLGLEIVAGSNFDKEKQVELNDGLVLNERAVAMFGWASPQEAIGKRIDSPSGFPKGKVIGVVKNYHSVGLQQQIGPMAMDYAPRNSYFYAIRYRAANTTSLVASLNQLWVKIFPGYDFNYFFLDQDFEKQYQAEVRLGQVFSFFSILTVIIGVIGLVGLVSFTAVSRTKEIGIRKILGADALSIAGLLSREYIILVVVANAVAFPLAWYFSGQWLQKFAYRTELDPSVFILTALIGIGITMAAVSFQTVKAASADPVNSLRYE
jgi:putative ABC transport system permease protein